MYLWRKQCSHHVVRHKYTNYICICTINLTIIYSLIKYSHQ